MIKQFIVFIFVLLIMGCVPKSDLEEANRQIVQLQTEVGTLRTQLAVTKKEKAELQEQLSRKPDLPITVGFRKAILGNGYVAMINTTTKKPVTVLATLQSAALGTKKTKELHLGATSLTELSYSDGFTIEIGDTMVFENTGYSPVTIIVEEK